MSLPNDRAPWFRCFPTALLGALAGMQPHQAYIYVTLLLRIYETGGAVSETFDTLSRRTGLSKKRVWEALEYLLEMGKLEQTDDGRFDSRSTHSEIVWQTKRREEQKNAGKISFLKREKKDPKNTTKSTNPVQRPFNVRSTDVTRAKELELELKKEKKEKEMDRVWVARDTPEWTAWQQVKKRGSIWSPDRQQNGWWFESQWPPNHAPEPAMGEPASNPEEGCHAATRST
jgi:uncharacterized protein YdaU (DUF1376 family)